MHRQRRRLAASAGTASAAYGFVSGIGATMVGMLIGQLYNGTAVPLIAGQAVVGGLSLLAVFITERGQLFGVGEDSEAG